MTKNSGLQPWLSDLLFFFFLSLRVKFLPTIVVLKSKDFECKLNVNNLSNKL